MALTASFAADFSAFTKSLSDAQVKLQTFDRATKNASRSLRRDLESFSGQKIAVEAARMAEAVRRLGGGMGVAGGVTKLTTSELKRFDATMQEAIEKARALGEELPASLKEVQGVLASLPKQSQKGFGSMFSAAATGAIAGGVAAIGTAALSAAKDLGRLAVEGIGEVVRRGGEVSSIRTSFENLSGGVAIADRSLGLVREATRGLVGDFDVMKASNKAMLLGLGLSGEGLADLAQSATVLGRAMGQSATQSLDDLITALGRSSPLILDNLGLTVDVTKANEAYARQIGKSASELTEAEKKQAFMNAALAAAKERVDELGGVQLTFADRLEVVRQQLGNVFDAMAQGVSQSPVLNAALEAIGDTLTAAFGENQTALVKGIVKAVNEFSMFVVDAGIYAVEFGHTAAKVFGVLQVPVRALSVAIIGVAEGAAKASAAIADLAAQLPGATPGMQAVADAARQQAEFLEDARKRGQDMLASSLDLARGQGPVHDGLNTVSGVLLDMKSRMEAAALSTAQYAEKSKQSSKASRDQAAADAAAATAAKKHQQEIDKQAEALRRLADQYTALKATIEPIGPAITNSSAGLDDMIMAQARALNAARGFLDEGPLVSQTINEAGQAAAIAAQATDEWADKLGARLRQALADAGVQIDETAEKARGFADTLQDTFAQLPGVIVGAFQGGGNAGQSIGGFLGGQLLGGKDGIGEQLGKRVATSLGGKIGGAIGAAVGSAVPVVGTLLGGLAGKFIGGLFGPGKGEQTNDLRDQLTAQAGGLEEVQKMARAAGKTMEEYYRISNPEDFQKFWDDLTKTYQENQQAATSLFDATIQAARQAGGEVPEQVQAMTAQLEQLGLLGKGAAEQLRAMNDALPAVKDTQAAAEALGADLNALGPKFEQAKVNETAVEIAKNIEALIRGTGNWGLSVSSAREEISELVQQSKKFKTEIPENLRPYIEDLAKSGNLVDENGNKIDDLSDLKFGKEIADQWQPIIDKLDELIDKIGDKLPKAINNIPDGNFNITGNVDTSGGGGDDVPSRAFGSKAMSGKWFENWGRGRLAMLHGEEAVVRKDDADQFVHDLLLRTAPKTSGGGVASDGSYAPLPVQINIDGRQAAFALVPYIPGALKRRGV